MKKYYSIDAKMYIKMTNEVWTNFVNLTKSFKKM